MIQETSLGAHIETTNCTWISFPSSISNLVTQFDKQLTLLRKYLASEIHKTTYSFHFNLVDLIQNLSK